MRMLQSVMIQAALLVGLGAGCAPIPPDLDAGVREQVIGKTREALLACAGTPANEVKQGGRKVLSYCSDCPPLERSSTGPEGSVLGAGQGCDATVMLERDRVIEIRYRPSARGGYDECDAIFAKCVR